MVPAFIRDLAPHRPVTFFLHIPFPPADVFRQCPWHQELLRGLLGCDVLGFQIGRYVDHFLRSAELLPGAHVDRDAMLVHYAGHTTKVGAFPIGADFHRFDGLARATERRSNRERVILAVDRLDYTKGIAERMHVFVRLLKEHPEHRERVVLVQLAVPSRPHLPEYQRLKRDVEALVEDVNRTCGTPGWTPVHYRYDSLPQSELVQLYRQADVALITPLSDGMNLVAKEYVACQFDFRGVLVLSRDAGASETMLEALAVDACDIGGSAATLHQALVMEESERRARMEALRRREERDDADAWVGRLLGAFL
jgi:trehalose 6-phosphate synthase/phosphatase